MSATAAAKEYDRRISEALARNTPRGPDYTATFESVRIEYGLTVEEMRLAVIRNTVTEAN